jgi:hypothetical protein
MMCGGTVEEAESGSGRDLISRLYKASSARFSQRLLQTQTPLALRGAIGNKMALIDGLSFGIS